jgi:hypothetical protein
MAEYDATEALHLLAEYAGRHRSFDKEMEKAGEALRKALLELHDKAGCRIESTSDGEGITLHLSQSRRAKVMVAHGFVQVQALEPPGSPVTIKLHYNPATKLLEGEEDDTFVTPGPGEPKSRKRSALAAVVKAALDAMDSAKG